MISAIWEEGSNNVYEKDFESQKHYISTICSEVRGMDPQILFDMRCVFVPNDEYLKLYFPIEVNNPFNDFYTQFGECKYMGKLMIPVPDIEGNTVGFIGYDPMVKLQWKDYKEGDVIKNAYSYSAKSIFERGKHVFTLKGVLEKAIKEGYVVIVDGTFDCINLNAMGINSIALMGSSINEYINFILSFIKVKYIAYDNDEAGISVMRTLKRTFPDLLTITQGYSKDIDGFISLVDKGKLKDYLMEEINSSIPKSIKLNNLTGVKVHKDT